MKNPILFAAAIAIGGFLAVANQASAQGTAFTYEGRLASNSIPANGVFDFTFGLYNAGSGGGQVGTTLTYTAIPVTNGLFMVTNDFGAVFNGAPYWLQIGVRTNGGGSFAALSPRQEIQPTPYAIYAESANAAGLAGALPSASLSGTYSSAVVFSNKANSFSGNGGGLTNLSIANFTGTILDTQLPPDAALLGASQTFTGDNIFKTGTNSGSVLIQGGTGIDTSLFTGLSLQYYVSSGEAALLASANDGNAHLTFYTKPAAGIPVLKQMLIDRYGMVAVDQQDNNNGVLNDGTTNGASLTFGVNSGEGIASQRTAGPNQRGLDFYTARTHRLSILNNGNVGIGTTNPATLLQVNGALAANSFVGDGSGLTNISAAALSSTILTNNEAGVTLPSLTISGALNLQSQTPTILAGANSFLYNDLKGNFFAGVTSGNTTLSGQYNIGIGSGALASDTSGTENIALGGSVLNNNTTGSFNTGSGFAALYNNTTASYNTADGWSALYRNLNGDHNTAAGYQALGNNTNGSYNVASGAMALAANTSGSKNVANGASALAANLGGDFNVANGYLALTANSSGGANTANGFQALKANTSGGNNTADGANSLFANVSGLNNTALGYGALENATADNNVVAIGYLALQNDSVNAAASFFGSSGNTAVGYEALQLGSTGSGATGLGWLALNKNQAFANTASGWGTMASTTSGGENTADGALSLSSNTSGSNNVAIGYAAMDDSVNTSDNSAVGWSALTANVSGNGNTALGASALQANTAGNGNTALGTASLYVSTGNNNIAIGNGAGDNLSSGDNDIYIGNNGVSSESGIIRIGASGTHSATYLAGTVYCQVMAITSDRNAKEHFAAINPRDVLDKVAALPVTQWNYKTGRPDEQHIGPMAQDFQAAFQLGADDKHISVSDEGGVALAAIQGLNQKLEETRAENTDLKRQNSALETRLRALEQAVQSLAQRQ